MAFKTIPLVLSPGITLLADISFYQGEDVSIAWTSSPVQTMSGFSSVLLYVMDRFGGTLKVQSTGSITDTVNGSGNVPVTSAQSQTFLDGSTDPGEFRYNIIGIGAGQQFVIAAGGFEVLPAAGVI